MQELFVYTHLFAWIEVVQEGRETLPHCDFCGMHIPAGQLLKHQRTKRCNRNMHMRYRRKDIAIVSRCEGEVFSLTGEDELECIEGVEIFKFSWTVQTTTGRKYFRTSGRPTGSVSVW